MSFKDYQQNSTTNFAALQAQLEKSNKPKGDDRIWKPTVDENGNGYAVIRFLPPPHPETLPFALVYNHAFKSREGKWLIETCPTTIEGNQCPICQANSRMWATKDDSQIAIARPRGRKTNFYSNIYVVSDPQNPENEGKVFLYRYGKMIMEKITKASKPVFADETAIDPFNMFGHSENGRPPGANFKIKIVPNRGGFWDYAPSKFDDPTAISPDLDEMEKIYNQIYPLAPFTDPVAAKIKSYEELERQFEETINPSAARKSVPSVFDEEEDSDPTPVAAAVPSSVPEAPVSSNNSDDDAYNFFQNLASKTDF